MQLRTLAASALAASTLGLTAETTAAQGSLAKELVAEGLSSPLWVGAPPGDSRIFALEQNQADIEIFSNGVKNPVPFLDLTGVVGTSGNERGLLSMAFHPDYANNGRFFAYFTIGSGSGSSRLAEYTVSANPDIANTAGTTVLQFNQTNSNHNGGEIHFGTDGYLYLSTGDGGGAGDTPCNAQNLTNLLGKMLRIDVDGGDDFPGDALKNYAIPPTNPFVGAGGGVQEEIFHYGLRNPWRWSFDSATGDMWIGDVGQNAREEVTMATAGESGVNFGWKIMEGFNCFSTSACVAPPPCNDPSLRLPVVQYNHNAAGGFSITGGYVYNGCGMPDYVGDYFYADYVTGNFWYLEGGTAPAIPITTLGSGLGSPTSFGLDGNGELLVVNQGGAIWRLVPGEDISADVASFSISGGGTQNILLTPGADRAGDLYFVAGSVTGTGPTPFGALSVPLTSDVWTTQTILAPNITPMVNSLGTLDSCGKATAGFSAGGGVLPASLVGTSAWHAYVVFEGLLPDYASADAVQIDFVL